MAQRGRPRSPIITKQVGIRLPVELWDRVHIVAAAAGTSPGGYVKKLIETVIDADERALAGRLAARGVVADAKPSTRRKSR